MSLNKIPKKPLLSLFIFFQIFTHTLLANTDTTYVQLVSVCGQTEYCLPIMPIDTGYYDFYMDSEPVKVNGFCMTIGGLQNDGLTFHVPVGESVIKAYDVRDQSSHYYIINVVESSPLTVSVTSEAASCNTNDGKITINATGGSGQYLYEWPSNVSNTDLNVAFNLEPGRYQVVVTDAINVTCFEVVNVLVTETIPGSSSFIVSDISKICSGEQTGYISFDVIYDQDFRLPFSVELIDSEQETVQNGSLIPGEYCLVLYDREGCVTADTCVIVESFPEMEFEVEVEHVFCDGSEGSASVEVEDGSSGGDYTFYWATLDTPQLTVYFDTTDVGTIGNLKPGDYKVFVENSFGCEGYAYFTVEDEDCPNRLAFLNAPVDKTIHCGESIPQHNMNAYTPCQTTGVMIQYSEYEIAGACEGNYFVVQNWEATDACGDTIIHRRFVTVRDFEAPEFEGFPDDLTINLSNNETIPSSWEILAFDDCSQELEYDFTETVDSTGSGYLILRTYSAKDACQNLTTATQKIRVTGGDVWPGDTDSSGYVNVYDVFNIGLGFGKTGPARAWSTDEWMGQYADAWDEISPVNGVNYRHADSNGDGKIDLDDINNVTKNWKGKTFFHQPREPQTRSTLPASLEIESVDGEGNVRMKVLVGETPDDALNVYGIAMRFDFPQDIVMENTVDIELSDSWLGVASEVFLFNEENSEEGYMDFAIVRTTRTDAIGGGQVAVLTFRLKPDYRNRDFNADFTIDNGEAIDNGGSTYETTAFEETLDIISSTKAPILSSDLLQLFPNPSKGQIELILNADIGAVEYTVFNSAGQLVKVIKATGANQIIDLTNEAEGIYILKMTSEQGVIIKKITIAY